MTQCRDVSRVSYKAILEMGNQIKAFLGRSPGSSNASLLHFIVDDEGYNDVDYEDDHGRRQHEVRSANYRGKSRAEQTIEQGLGSSYRHPDLPSSFVAKTIERRGLKYP